MNELPNLLLINLLGFAVGVVLYALLLAMTLRHPVEGRSGMRFDFLLLATGILGLLWNAGELAALVAHDFGLLENTPLLTATSCAALGFLPAVMVHLTLQTGGSEKSNGRLTARLLTFSAYSLSTAAAICHFESAIFAHVAPSTIALQILTYGYLAILAALILSAFQQTIARKTALAAALAVFAVSALHLSHPHDGSNLWIVEIFGHQASLPLVLAILYQDFRFAFADLFLKRALSLLFLTLAVFSLYVFAAAPLLEMHRTHSATDSQPTFILLGFWVLTALLYPALHKAAVWLVDKILLQRVNYENLRKELAQRVERSEMTENVLDEVCQILAAALTAKAVWTEIDWQSHKDGNTFFKRNAEDILIVTAEAPFFEIHLRDFSGGRRLLSDELEMLESAAILTARRIDVLRVTHERCEQEIREQHIGKLASEAELRALRAQLNPHFLFNALTTIGYLIQTAPDKALNTLLQLTQLLRGVLRSTGEFSALGDELKLIESYLEIERARFEERLQVEIQVAPELLKLRVPSLILQSLVENAVKHGIAPQKIGGKVCITARVDGQNLILQVSDTGVGVDESEFAKRRGRGIGLQNIEARLRSHFGTEANLSFESKLKSGTTAEIKIPLSNIEIVAERRRLAAQTTAGKVF